MSPASPKEENLTREVEYIFKNLFPKKELTQDIKIQYTLFGNKLCNTGNNVKIRKIIDHKLDVEAIEFFLRIRDRENILTQKIHALIYLIEVKKDFYDEFYVEKDFLLKGLFTLIYFTLRSIYKFFKGFIQVRLYGII